MVCFHSQWFMARWAFHYVLNEASKLCPNDNEVIDALDLAKGVG
jgi:hypothetical protein